MASLKIQQIIWVLINSNSGLLDGNYDLNCDVVLQSQITRGGASTALSLVMAAPAMKIQANIMNIWLKLRRVYLLNFTMLYFKHRKW